ncbi:NADP-dependent glutamate dehydrogenase [Balamuthia mandrillaris]
MATGLPLEKSGEEDGSPVFSLFEKAKQRDPDQKEFLQAFEEVLESLQPLLEREPKYLQVLERMAEPERVIMFRVPWIDDKGKWQVNRGYRVQFNSALGPYKGGLRFHPSVNLSIMKFLAFEQILKNSLTTLPIGGAKGGSDFDPKGKSDNEVMSFCQSFMTELYRHIGAAVDVPAGDIGVGSREIGYLFGQYKRLTKSFEGVLTGKRYNWGGSLIRPEATGYGLVYFAQEVLHDNGLDLKGQRCLISGSGNVSQYCAEKLMELGAIVLTLSDSNGTVFEPEGFNKQQLAALMEIKNEKRGRVKDYLEYSSSCKYFDKLTPWALLDSVDYAFPCATQNEIDEEAARSLLQAGCKGVFEGANMPSTNEAIQVYHEGKMFFAPAKASNAGGVATSALEMSQNSQRLQWSAEEVDHKLKDIMRNIYLACKHAAEKYGRPGNLQLGANIAGFLKVADSMLDQGCV